MIQGRDGVSYFDFTLYTQHHFHCISCYSRILVRLDTLIISCIAPIAPYYRYCPYCEAKYRGYNEQDNNRYWNIVKYLFLSFLLQLHDSLTSKKNSNIYMKNLASFFYWIDVCKML